jgi:hypothetical protein
MHYNYNGIEYNIGFPVKIAYLDFSDLLIQKKVNNP